MNCDCLKSDCVSYDCVSYDCASYDCASCVCEVQHGEKWIDDVVVVQATQCEWKRVQHDETKKGDERMHDCANDWCCVSTRCTTSFCYCTTTNDHGGVPCL